MLQHNFFHNSLCSSMFVHTPCHSKFNENLQNEKENLLVLNILLLKYLNVSH